MIHMKKKEKAKKRKKVLVYSKTTTIRLRSNKVEQLNEKNIYKSCMSKPLLNQGL